MDKYKPSALDSLLDKGLDLQGIQVTSHRTQSATDHPGLPGALYFTERCGQLNNCHLRANGQGGSILCVPFPLGL